MAATLETPRELETALSACRGSFVGLAVFSAGVNVLMLTAPLYMLQVFDRVLASRSTDTLLMLSLIAGVALLTLAALEGVRSFSLLHISSWLDARLGSSVLQASIASALRKGQSPSAQGLRDLSTFRTFVGGPSMFPIMDAPWTPLFIAVVFMLNPILGWMALGGALVLLVLALTNETATRGLLQRAGDAQIQAMDEAEAAVLNADVIEAMGMMADLTRKWHGRSREALQLQSRASARSGIITAVSKFIRLALQVGMLGVGAWLVIQNELTPGGMIAGTILLGRALAPVDQAIVSWKALIAARAAYQRVKTQLAGRRGRPGQGMSLPQPTGQVRCEGVTFTHPDTQEPTLRNIDFDLPAGKVLGLIGPTASGKTTLARLLVGNLTPQSGHVRLDGMDIAQWASADRGRHVGYLPQDVELFDGSVKENIARMTDGKPDTVVSAARLAGVHDMILRLPQGYDTQIGSAGAALSGGQRQRVALARAVYGEPCFIVLDEPNSNLDQAGVEALSSALVALKRRGATVVLVAHQPSLVREADYLMVLAEGSVKLAGPRDEVIPAVTQAHG